MPILKLIENIWWFLIYYFRFVVPTYHFREELDLRAYVLSGTHCVAHPSAIWRKSCHPQNTSTIIIIKEEDLFFINVYFVYFADLLFTCIIFIHDFYLVSCKPPLIQFYVSQQF